MAEEKKAEKKAEKKEKKEKREGKKPHRNKPTSKKYKFYVIEGNEVKRKKACPRCGPGTFLAEAKNRFYCGKCHYTSFEKN